MKIDLAAFIDRLVLSDPTFDRANPKPKIDLEFYDPKLKAFIKRIEILGIDGRTLFYRFSGKFDIERWNVKAKQRWVVAVKPPKKRAKALIQVNRYE